MHHNHADTDNDAEYEANIKTLHRNFMVRKKHPTLANNWRFLKNKNLKEIKKNR
jgi:hypothetical protein